MRPVRQWVDAPMISTSTPITRERAVAASSSKLNRNGAAMKRMAAAYSTIPWTNAGTGPCLNTARKLLPEEDRRRLVQARIEQLRLRERFVERDELDLGPAQRRHLAEGARVRRLRGGDAEARAEHAVVGQRRAAALDVPEDRHARLEARARLDLLLEVHGDAAEADGAEGVGALVLGPDVAVLGRRPLGHDDDRERAAGGLA